ncbi:hypothetical protein AB8B21_05540 [Tardiphaga sp. 866_E4_N2_1]|uniref:hypothetical protein n=1 Tax=unclassified Tardiphaga TaxID=2631404 RepID=UPI003F24F744
MCEVAMEGTVVNPFEKTEFRESLKSAFVEAIHKIGYRNFKKISWFASNEMASSEEIRKAA